MQNIELIRKTGQHWYASVSTGSPYGPPHLAHYRLAMRLAIGRSNLGPSKFAQNIVPGRM